jgi:hypothetical protein
MRRCRSSLVGGAKKGPRQKLLGRTPSANTFKFCNTIGGIATVAGARPKRQTTLDGLVAELTTNSHPALPRGMFISSSRKR